MSAPAIAVDPLVARHAFRTFLGLPPGDDEDPVCGVVLPADWGVPPTAPSCPACEHAVRATLNARST